MEDWVLVFIMVQNVDANGGSQAAAERNTKHQTPSSREIPESKHQKPSSKHQRNPKFQAPNRGPRFELGAWSFSGVWNLVFGVWDLELLWSLEFGIWSLMPGLSASQELRCAPQRARESYRLTAANSCSVFSRNWPQAASMSWPFSRRNVAITFCFSNAARKASCACSVGRVQGKPSTLLYGIKFTLAFSRWASF